MTAALALTRRGVRVTVVEREVRVGGLCGTHEHRGFRFDYGGHRFITQSTEIDRFVRDSLGDQLLTRTRSSVVVNGGVRYQYPLQLDDVLAKYGVARGARALASYARANVAQRLQRREAKSFRDWVVQRFGRDLYDTFFGPYTEKLWGMAPETISADWAAQRISIPSLNDVVLRLLGVRRPEVRTYARQYLYPRLGIGQIFENFEKEVAENGGVIRHGAEVISVRTSRGRVQAVAIRDEAGEHEIPCDAVLSTIALPAFARMLGSLDREGEASAGRLRFRAIRMLNVLLEGPPVSPHTWMYISEPSYLAARIQEPIHRSPSMAPPGCTSLMFEVPCEAGDAVWSAPDAQIYERCMSDAERLGIHGLRGRTIDSFSSFVREGYPIYHLDYGADRERLLAHVGRTSNVITCGRQGGFRYIFMDTAMEMGLRAAEAIEARGARRNISELRVGGGLIEACALTA